MSKLTGGELLLLRLILSSGSMNLPEWEVKRSEAQGLLARRLVTAKLLLWPTYEVCPVEPLTEMESKLLSAVSQGLSGDEYNLFASKNGISDVAAAMDSLTARGIVRFITKDLSSHYEFV